MTLPQVKHIGILLFNDVEELDAIGPWEVLSYWTRNHPEDGFAVSCLSKAGGLVHCSKGLAVQPHYSYADAPPLEVLVHTRAVRRRWRCGDLGRHLRRDRHGAASGVPPRRCRPSPRGAPRDPVRSLTADLSHSHPSLALNTRARDASQCSDFRKVDG